jgi:hypothetical protein
MSLSDAERAKLVRLLGMLNSNFDAERATAAALADRFIRDRGLTWNEIVNDADEEPHQQYWGQPPPPVRTWRDVAAACQRKCERLNQWERDFLASILAWRRSLTQRQAAKLDDIAERLGVEPDP